MPLSNPWRVGMVRRGIGSKRRRGCADWHCCCWRRAMRDAGKKQDKKQKTHQNTPGQSPVFLPGSADGKWTKATAESAFQFAHEAVVPQRTSAKRLPTQSLHHRMVRTPVAVVKALSSYLNARVTPVRRLPWACRDVGGMRGVSGCHALQVVRSRRSGCEQ